MDQSDLFGGPRQLGFALEDTRPDPTAIDPDAIREELVGILALARAARDEAPWDRRTHAWHRVVFPQMTDWLPADEAAALRAEFRAELDRIEPMLAPA